MDINEHDALLTSFIQALDNGLSSEDAPDHVRTAILAAARLASEFLRDTKRIAHELTNIDGNISRIASHLERQG